MIILCHLECSPFAIPAISTDDFGNRVHAVHRDTPLIQDGMVAILDDLWWHLFDMSQHIEACREIAP